MPSKRNTIEQQEALVAQLHTATHDAAVNALLGFFEPLIKSQARRYEQATAGVELEDLEQVARMGLLAACASFDRAKGAFPTHAIWSIRLALANWVRCQGNPVRLPARWMAKLPTLRRLTQRLSQELSREPTLNELAVSMQLSEVVIASMLAYDAGPVMIDAVHDQTTASKMQIRRRGIPLSRYNSHAVSGAFNGHDIAPGPSPEEILIAAEDANIMVITSLRRRRKRGEK